MTIKITTRYKEYKTAREMAEGYVNGKTKISIVIDNDRNLSGIITEFRGK